MISVFLKIYTHTHTKESVTHRDTGTCRVFYL